MHLVQKYGASDGASEKILDALPKAKKKPMEEKDMFGAEQWMIRQPGGKFQDVIEVLLYF